MTLAVAGCMTIITGKKGQGKTSFIQQFISTIADVGLSLQGLTSPARFHLGVKTGIDVENITTGERKQLAYFEPGWDLEMPAREWRFDDDALAWGDLVLQELDGGGDVLIIDEVGYLELEKGQGWQSIFPLLEKKHYLHAYVVVRESLLSRALKFWGYAKVISLAQIEDKAVWIENEVKMLRHQKGTCTGRFQTRL